MIKILLCILKWHKFVKDDNNKFSSKEMIKQLPGHNFNNSFVFTLKALVNLDGLIQKDGKTNASDYLNTETSIQQLLPAFYTDIKWLLHEDTIDQVLGYIEFDQHEHVEFMFLFNQQVQQTIFQKWLKKRFHNIFYQKLKFVLNARTRRTLGNLLRF